MQLLAVALCQDSCSRRHPVFYCQSHVLIFCIHAESALIRVWYNTRVQVIHTRYLLAPRSLTANQSCFIKWYRQVATQRSLYHVTVHVTSRRSAIEVTCQHTWRPRDASRYCPGLIAGRLPDRVTLICLRSTTCSAAFSS